MSIESAKLEAFREANPVDARTQAIIMLDVLGDRDLIIYTLMLGIITARQRKRHVERSFIKVHAEAPQPLQRIKPSPKIVKLILDTWMLNGQRLGDATSADLSAAISQGEKNIIGINKNNEFYAKLQTKLTDETQRVRDKWTEKTVAKAIEEVYG